MAHTRQNSRTFTDQDGISHIFDVTAIVDPRDTFTEITIILKASYKHWYSQIPIVQLDGDCFLEINTTLSELKDSDLNGAIRLYKESKEKERLQNARKASTA